MIMQNETIVLCDLQACYLESRPGPSYDAKVRFRAGTNRGFHSFT